MNYKNICDKLDRWVSKRGHIGIDPYDIRGTPIFLKAQKVPIIRKIAYFSAVFFPRVWIKLLNVKPNKNSKALALFILAYTNMFNVTNEGIYVNKIKKLINELLKQQHKKMGGWGYPFDWQTKKELIPRGTPSSVVTSFVVHALTEAYGYIDNKNLREAIERSSLLFENYLNRNEDNGLLFSYTPLDHRFVYNANALSAFALFKISKITGEKTLNRMAIKIAKTVLDFQKNDGSWSYGLNSPVIDNYHMGYTLEYLYRMRLKDRQSMSKLNKGLEFFKRNLIKNQKIPKFKPNFLYPIDIDSCAETIILFSLTKHKEIAKKVLDWTIKNMKNQDGSFYYQMYPFMKIKYPFMRWSQAWMLRAISEYLINFHDKNLLEYR